MNEKLKWVLRIVFILFVVSACNLFSIGLDKVDEVISDIEDLPDQIPVDEIVEDIETLATDIPVEFDDIGEEIETLITEIPSELENLGEVSDLGDIQDLIEDGLLSGEAPEDIPIVEDPKEILIESEELISYLTPHDYLYIKDFYLHQMPNNGWALLEENIINDNSSLLIFEKSSRKATITINFNLFDENTNVMIFIQSTE